MEYTVNLKSVFLIDSFTKTNLPIQNIITKIYEVEIKLTVSLFNVGIGGLGVDERAIDGGLEDGAEVGTPCWDAIAS